MAYRINDLGIDVLRVGGNVNVPADWVRVLSFEGANGTPAKVNIGPSDAATSFSKDGAGNPTMSMPSGAGAVVQSPAIQRSTGGAFQAQGVKIHNINFGVTFQAVPGVTFALSDTVSTVPKINSITVSGCQVETGQNYSGIIYWTAIEPAS